jgi:hypothetical protein
MKKNRSAWNMKKKGWISIPLVVILFLVGCASVGPKVQKMDNVFINDISKHKDMKVGLINFKSTHLGSTGRQAAIGIFGYIKSSEEKEYAHNLDMKCCKVIEEIINEKPLFNLKSDKLIDIPKLEDIDQIEDEYEKRQKREKNENLIKQFIESNDLIGALYVKPYFGVTISFNKKVTLRTRWIMYGNDGRPSINITTYYEADKAEEIFPNTLDPKYEKTFLELTKTSTDNFISVLMREN